MKTIRAYIYKSERSAKPIMALECHSVTTAEAKVAAEVDLQSLKPGMVFRLVKNRQPDMASSRTIQRIDQRKTGQSIIHFAVSESTEGTFAGSEAAKPQA